MEVDGLSVPVHSVVLHICVYSILWLIEIYKRREFDRSSFGLLHTVEVLFLFVATIQCISFIKTGLEMFCYP